MNFRAHSDDTVENLFLASKTYIKPFWIQDYTTEVMRYIKNYSFSKSEILNNSVLFIKYLDNFKKAINFAQKNQDSYAKKELEIFFVGKEHLLRNEKHMNQVLKIIKSKKAVLLLVVIESLKDCMFKKYIYREFLKENQNENHLAPLIKKVMVELDYLVKKTKHLNDLLNKFYLDYFIEED